ncbi:MAG TPA: CHAT domain-containing tetratricopeptide repeat protein [Acidimicrobiales bacterium]|nr:CHAT domain-containing tetratricopeptide repeat protein [Acidimicrobiales bacterium]
MGDDLARISTSAEIVEEALRLCESEPREALSLADRAELSAESTDPRTIGLTEWARGRALRHLGRHRDASDHLEAAVRLLGSSGDPEAAARATVSLALERIDTARFDEAIDLLDAAHRNLSGGEAARAVAQKALALQRSDRVTDALSTWDQAIDEFTRAGMPIERAVALQNRGIVQIYRGDLDAAEADLDQAGQTFRHNGQEIRAVEVVHNLGLVDARRGDLPSALARFDAAQAEAGRLGAVRPQMLVDRVQVALEAGLTGEGRQMAELAVRLLADDGYEADVPEACLLAARACELDGDPAAAASWATQAAELFSAQKRFRWELLARLAAAKVDSEPGPGLADELARLGRRLRRAGWRPPALEAETLAVGLLIRSGRMEEAGRLLDGLRQAARSAPPLTRLQIRLVQARYALAAGQVVGARRAVVAAVRALRAYEATVGSIELRSRAGGHSEAVIGAGVALTLATGEAGDALWCAEMVRSTAGSRVGTTGVDGELQDLIEALRDVDRALGGPAAAAVSERLRRRRAALEEVIRRRSRHSRGSPAALSRSIDLTNLEEHFTDTHLIEFVVADQCLFGLVVASGQTRIVPLAAVNDVRRVVAGLRMTLGIAVSDPDAGAHFDTLTRAGEAAGRMLVEPLGLTGSQRVVIVPDMLLASFPWSLVPDFAETELSVATSAAAWVGKATADWPRAEPTVVLIGGPDLHHADSELEAIGKVWPQARTIIGAEATVANVLSAVQDADLVHIAAHATHRGDHPLLSGIRLFDGHLTGHELSTHEIPARVVVLSCCETGMAENAGGIGLSRLITEHSGASTAVASVSPLADRSAGPLMTGFHQRLAAGSSPARALVDSRQALGGPVRYPSAAGVICFGVG